MGIGRAGVGIRNRADGQRWKIYKNCRGLFGALACFLETMDVDSQLKHGTAPWAGST